LFPEVGHLRGYGVSAVKKLSAKPLYLFRTARSNLSPVALKLALDQMKLLVLIEVPLKFVLTELV
jgi:hypothetical protein